TAANTYLDRYVERRNRDAELPWRNVIWEHWITGGSGGAAMRDDHGCTAEQACLLYDALIGDDRTGPVAISIDDLNDRAARSRSVEQAKTQRAEPDLAVPTGNGQPRPTLSTAYVAPRDELEQRLARIWTDLLGITPIGVLDSFFELGGESLAAMQLLSRLRDDYEVDLPLGQLFKEATVALLADMIRQRPAPGPPLDPAPAAVDEPIGDPGEIERILREIEQLSDDDVERELARGTEPDL
ncbi:MAG TPA: phosphopantetheine-binding protein, partial [Aldersonia sp.]